MGYLSNAIKHFKTISKHRRLVRQGCFKVGLYYQGLTHDLSKYSWTEFSVGIKYWQGIRSPNVAQRRTIGYSTAWMHHKGRNKHHYEYWTDYSEKTFNHLEPMEMPAKYFVEMVMDRIAACKVYKGENYHDGSSLEYLMDRDKPEFMNRKTYDDLLMILTMLKESGEDATFRYLKDVYLTKESPKVKIK